MDVRLASLETELADRDATIALLRKRQKQLRALVAEMPMASSYAGEPSSLRPIRKIGPFLRGLFRASISVAPL